MKRFFFILFLGIIALPLISQADLSDNDIDLDAVREEDPYLYSLLMEKQEIDDLYASGEIKKVQRAFKRDQKKLERYLKKKDLENLNYQNFDTQIIYADISEFQDLLIYYDAYTDFLNGAIRQSRNGAESLIDNYPQSSKFDPSVLLLMEIYFYQQENEKLIEVSGLYKDKYSEDQKYWLAQAHFNLENYTTAQELFNDLRKSRYYRFRAEMMKALVSYFTEDIDAALKQFFALEEEYKPKTPYYYFLYLSLARLLAEKEYQAAALDYYEKFVDSFPGEISDDIYFEIASRFREYKDYENAIFYYNRIVEKPRKSSYFPAAKYYVSVVEQERGNFKNATGNLEDIIAQNDLVMETLNVKYQLMDDYNEHCYDLFFLEMDEEEKTSKEEKCLELEEAIATTNRNLQDLYTGIDRKSVLTLNLIEEEYFSYSTTIEYIDAIIQLASTTQNKKVPRIIDSYITELDSSLVTIGIINYLGHLPQVSSRDIQIARLLTEERLFEESLMEAWQDIGKIAAKRNDPEMKASAERSIELLELNLESIENISKIAFKGSPSPEVRELIMAETGAIEQNIEDLRILKQQVIEKFNIQIAKKLTRQKSAMITEFDFLKNSYDDVIGIVAGDLDQTNKNYEFNLLDVHFRQSNTLEKEYEEMQRNYQEPASNE